MGSVALEGVVENGQIRLLSSVRLPEKAKVYILIPEAEVRTGAYIGSPRLAHPEQAADFEKQVVVLEADQMPAYDTRLFHPPAPLARVTLRNPETGKTVSDVPMLVDSGADVTLLPQQSLTPLTLVLDGPRLRWDEHSTTGR